MQLVGRYLSPFVRRVGATLHLYGMDYEHVPMATQGEDRSRIQSLNPVTRVPALVLDDGEVLVDSAAILDYLDEQVGPERALTPAVGPARRRVLKLCVVAAGAAEKAVLTVYENRFRPPEKRHAPWVEMVGGQARDALQWVDGQIGGTWLTGESMTQADVTAACVVGFIKATNPELYQSLHCPALVALSERAEALPAFKATTPET
jgi:glutathione S-transferase